MEHDFWHKRWLQNQIGFHQTKINPYLQRFCPLLTNNLGQRIFVPLCGKSLDMIWLADQGHSVLGVEISPIAVEAFFIEHKLNYTKTVSSRFLNYQFDRIELRCGDFFDLTVTDLADIVATYDRASLIAFPAIMRERYAQHLIAILPPITPILLIALEYAEHEMQGPPFSVFEQEVRTLFNAKFNIRMLESNDILGEMPHFRDKGLTALTEKVYLLKPR